MVRVKYRYIVAKIELQDETKTGATTFNDYSVYNCILKNVQKFYGDLGVAAIRSGLKCKYCNDQTRIAIVRVKHKAHRFVTCTLALSTVIGDHLAKFRILYVGPTIMQCNKFIVKHHKQFLDRMVNKMQSAGQQKHFVKQMMDNVSTF